MPRATCRDKLQKPMNRLLLIDDEEDVQYSFRRIFDSPEIELATASSGEEGLKLIPKFEPDLVLMDIRMGGITGLETLRRIRQMDLEAAGDPDDGLRDDADGYRGDEAGGLRLSAETVRRAEAQGNRGQRFKAARDMRQATLPAGLRPSPPAAAR